MAKVSVILPVYNVGEYLKECLDSLINQTLKDIEIICINDGSTDNSPEILEQYAQKDSRFIIVSQENRGQGIARNKGVEIAGGEYIQFIDPDDWVETDMLETLYRFAENNASKVVKFNYTEYNDYTGMKKEHNFAEFIKKKYGYDLAKTPYYSWKLLKDGCLYDLGLNVWSSFYSAEFIKENNIKFAPNKHAEDHLFANEARLLADKVDYLDKSLYFYRRRKGSSVCQKTDDNFCIFDNIELLKSFLIEHNLYQELNDEFSKYVRVVLKWHYMVPEESKGKYEKLCERFFSSGRDYKKFLKELKKQKSFIEQIFSIKNEYIDVIKYKVITIFGVKIYLKPKGRERNEEA